MTKTLLLAAASVLVLGAASAQATGLWFNDNNGNKNDTYGNAINGEDNDYNEQNSDNNGTDNKTGGSAVNGEDNDDNDVNSHNDGNNNKIDDYSNGVIGEDNDDNVIDSFYLDKDIYITVKVKSEAYMDGYVTNNKVKAESDAGDGDYSDDNYASAKVHNGGVEVKGNDVIGGVLQISAVNGANSIGQQNANITANGSFNDNISGVTP